MAKKKTTIQLTPKQQFMIFDLADVDEVLLGGQAGGGKGSPLNAKVLTPFGWSTMGEMKTGSMVCNPDGSIAKVIGVYPLGKKQLYEFIFQDGATTEVTEDHLWLAWKRRQSSKYKGEKQSGENGAKIWTTEQLYKSMQNGGRGSKFSIPISDSVTFTDGGPYERRPVSPYLLGVLLGDGSLLKGNITFSSADREIALRIHKEGIDVGKGYVNVKKSAATYRLPQSDPAIKYLKKCGLIGKHANNKFIPKAYLLGSIEQRWELLKGLMDSDGWVEKDGDIYYCTISQQLASDITELARSLGGYVTIRQKNPVYTYKGEKLNGQKAYTLRFKFRDSSKAFSLPRKQNLAGRIPQSMGRKIISIKKSRIAYAQCIKVNHPNGLYITDDFIVTHNSEGLLMFALLRRIQCPGSVGLMMRKTYPDLDKSLIRKSFNYYKPYAKWNESKRKWTFKNGSIEEFGYCESDKDVYQYQSTEYDDVCLDEITHFTEFQVLYMMSRLRSSKAGDWKTLMRGATNPGNIGHLWVKSRYVDVARNKIYKSYDEILGTHKTRYFLPATLEDNTLYPPEKRLAYKSWLAQLPEAERKQLMDGDWDHVPGAAFAELKRDVHGYNPEDHPVPKWATIFMSYDFGFGAPFSIQWFWVDFDGRMWLFKEWYGWNGKPNEGLRMATSDVAAGILRKETDSGIKNDITRIAGHDIFGKTPNVRGGGQGPSVAEIFSEHGVYFNPGDPDRQLGKQQVHERLKVSPEFDKNDPLTYPMLMVSHECEQFWRTVPVLQRGDPGTKQFEDVKDKQEDHPYDSLKIACMSRPISPQFEKPVDSNVQKMIKKVQSPTKHDILDEIYDY